MDETGFTRYNPTHMPAKPLRPHLLGVSVGMRARIALLSLIVAGAVWMLLLRDRAAPVDERFIQAVASADVSGDEWVIIKERGVQFHRPTCWKVQIPGEPKSLVLRRQASNFQPCKECFP